MKTRMIVFFTAIFCITGLINTTEIFALQQEVWVKNVSGNDSYAGTATNPVKTIKRAVELVADIDGKIHLVQESKTTPIVSAEGEGIEIKNKTNLTINGQGFYNTKLTSDTKVANYDKIAWTAFRLINSTVTVEDLTIDKFLYEFCILNEEDVPFNASGLTLTRCKFIDASFVVYGTCSKNLIMQNCILFSVTNVVWDTDIMQWDNLPPELSETSYQFVNNVFVFGGEIYFFVMPKIYNLEILNNIFSQPNGDMFDPEYPYDGNKKYFNYNLVGYCGSYGASYPIDWLNGEESKNLTGEQDFDNDSEDKDGYFQLPPSFSLSPAERDISIDGGNPKSEYNDLNGTINDLGAYGGPKAKILDYKDKTAPTITDLTNRNQKITTKNNKIVFEAQVKDNLGDNRALPSGVLNVYVSILGDKNQILQKIKMSPKKKHSTNGQSTRIIPNSYILTRKLVVKNNIKYKLEATDNNKNTISTSKNTIKIRMK